MKEIFYAETYSNDPCYNLAFEDYLFHHLPHGCSCLLLWQNDSSVIIGRYQNAYAEINLPYVEEHKLPVVRRMSGGGAVYHDLGNLNYTIISAAQEEASRLDIHSFCMPVVRTLANLGVTAELSGRNDILIAGKKISGNAQYVRNGRVLHHGTLLFSSDLSCVENALRPSAAKIESKGISSVRSRVTNIADHLPASARDLGSFKEILLQELSSGAHLLPFRFDAEDLAAIRHSCQTRYQTWEWNFGNSPTFRYVNKRAIPGCGILEVMMDVDNGQISKLQFCGDFFSFLEPDGLADKLVGCLLEKAALENTLLGIDVDAYIHGLDANTLISLLLS